MSKESDVIKILGTCQAERNPSVTFITLVRIFEILLDFIVLIHPLKPILLFIMIYKRTTGFLYPIFGMPIWEFAGRFGSYKVPFTLYYRAKTPDNRRSYRFYLQSIGFIFKLF